MIVINKPSGIHVYDMPDNTIVKYAVQAYSFILPYNRPHTALQFAKMISLYYDDTEPRNKAVINALVKCD